MQEFCISTLTLTKPGCKNSAESFSRVNSLKNQQQMDNAGILHFNFDTYKIWMQKFCRASFRQIHYKNNTKH